MVTAPFFTNSMSNSDLFSSMIKRKIDIKDFSNFLGSHGGFLDRLDSIIAAAFYINILFILELL